jgi:hypothetical protein
MSDGARVLAGPASSSLLDLDLDSASIDGDLHHHLAGVAERHRRENRLFDWSITICWPCRDQLSFA